MNFGNSSFTMSQVCAEETLAGPVGLSAICVSHASIMYKYLIASDLVGLVPSVIPTATSTSPTPRPSRSSETTSEQINVVYMLYYKHDNTKLASDVSCHLLYNSIHY